MSGVYDIPPDLYNKLVEHFEAQREESLSMMKSQKFSSHHLRHHVRSLAEAENVLISLEKNFTQNID